MPGFGDGDIDVCHNSGFSIFISTQSNTLYWAVFIKNEKQVRWPTRIRYTDKDAEDVAAGIMSTPVTETVVFGELWKSRFKSGLVPIEEGVLNHWHSGRIVLVGDAAHKVSNEYALFIFAWC